MHITDEKQWIAIMPVEDLPTGNMVGIDLGDLSIALYHLDDGSHHATSNVCTHGNALLTDGWLEGCNVECPLHGGCFEVKTGKGLCAPINKDLEIYPVRILDDMIYLAVDQKA
ncbi:non-heme iron oxygenase ferredoxin subunit [Ensifer sp. YR511]|uniref:non-heme iron oxygenase ferredoxin subunit n=1 Tax=Ensifer sp. YR511 TaxID=1855294 RepID=UPI000886F27E|nr:non-heme iron oxygenase ferredoxin subunit [Ensifer sp. YR511]SDN43075.1 naphthalene 1,2-dioxygenase system ferredoxin subunit [Ensifer sp. YR511]